MEYFGVGRVSRGQKKIKKKKKRKNLDPILVSNTLFCHYYYVFIKYYPNIRSRTRIKGMTECVPVFGQQRDTPVNRTHNLLLFL